MHFADRLVEEQRRKQSLVVVGIDPQLDSVASPGVPSGYTLTRLCCEVVEACAPSAVAVKPQLAYFEARGLEGMRALVEVNALARRLGLLIIADAKRGDIGSTSAAYAEAFLGEGDFHADAVTVNPYQGSDALAPFIARARTLDRGLFVLVKTSNPSAGEFQDRATDEGPLWERVAARVCGWGDDLIGLSGMSAVGAVVGATYPADARRARELMPRAPILVPGYGAQGATAADSIAARRREEPAGIVVNASRSLMYAYLRRDGMAVGAAAAEAAESMRVALNAALESAATAA